MCGIAGILNLDGALPDLQARVANMQRSLLHRGPDGKGDWRSPQGHCVFAHTRLAVIDPTSRASQPMSVGDGGLTLVMNGEIYNFLELRRELERRRISFRSHSDAEVVLRAYETWGDACIERLRGMFAIAIWDESNRRCLLARDRFGIKPLYFTRQAGLLVFASELRGILASGLVEPDVDATAVYEYFRRGSFQEPRTIVANVESLEAGHLAVWQDGSFRRRAFWELRFGSEAAPADIVEKTRTALSESVRQHCISDVPIGVFLSGGMDSTAVLALAKLAGRDVRALTIALPGSDADESATARSTARHFGVRHDVCDVDADTGAVLLDEWLRAMDQPSIDGLNTLAVSRLARSVNVKVALSGIGADELFGGYPSARWVPRLASWSSHLGPMRGFAGQLLERASDPRWRRVGEMLQERPGVAASHAAFRGIFTRAEALKLTNRYCGRDPVRDDDSRDPSALDPTPQDATSRLELTRYLRNQVLRETDVASMSCGVEVRTPFLDESVVNVLTAVRAADRLAARKSLLLRAVSEIPESVAGQPKRGFMLPFDQWHRDRGNDVFAVAGADSGVPMTTWYRKMAILAMSTWLERRTAFRAAVRPDAVLSGVRND